MKTYLTAILFFLLPGGSQAQTDAHNYVKHDVMLDSLRTRKKTSVQYYDGLGRPSLSVANGIGGDGGSIRALVSYGVHDMPVDKWLPVAGGSTLDFITESEFKSQSQTFYGDSYAKVQNSYDYLDRAVSSYGAGKAWRDAGKDSKTAYGTNNAEEVKRYEALCDGTFRLVEDGYYAKGTLYVKTASDEDGHSLAVYVDLRGNKVLERRSGNNDTYYVYDDLGNLRFVLSPEYQNSKNLTGLCYEYRYDGRHRCTWKRMPGCEPVEYWYDRGDRIVCFRDGELRADGLFRFFLYDKLGRLSVQGVCTSCATGENDIPVVSYTPVFSGFGGSLYQIPAGKAQPQNAEIELVNYYDNHSFLNFNGFHKKDACYNILNGGSSTNARNLLTGTVTCASDGSMLCSVTYYDHRHRPSDVRRTYADGVAVVMTTEYSFTGKPLTVQYTVYKDGATIPMTIENTYGEANDLPVSSVLKANGCEIVLASNEYDGIGRLSKVTRGSNALYQQYSYSVRGWLTQIAGNGFREDLYYTDGTVPCYNGDISRVKWDGDTSTPTNSSYNFRYDSLDRLVASEYTLHADTEKNFDNSEYFTYNFNGSPLTLKRHGRYMFTDRDIGYALVNDMSFSYDGNRLTGISDAGSYSGFISPYVFHENTSADVGYAYNSNGSMTRNPDRHIGLMEYDGFNNPRLIQFTDGSVTEYVYDASGVKLKTLHRTAVPGIDVPYGTVYEHTSSTVLSSDSTLYAGPFVLSGDSLRYQYDGGSVLIPLDGSPVKPCFYALDHLGSVRLVVSADGQVIERNDYYPSGCLITENIDGETVILPYKYNGKELDPMHGLYTYDYGARQYDPATMLWDRMDPLCEDNPEVSPYVYCGDNPVVRYDPDGMDWYRDKDKTWQYSPNVHSQKDLAKGQIYKGKSFFTVNGTNLEQYRSDGSILYTDENAAYNRMWDQANRHYRTSHEKEGREVGGFILSNGKVLVLPDYNNDESTTKIKEYGYLIDNKTVKHKNEKFSVMGLIHTHQSKNGSPSPSFFGNKGEYDGSIAEIIDGPVFTMGHDDNVWVIIQNESKQAVTKLPFKLTYLLNNRIRFSKYVRNNNWNLK